MLETTDNAKAYLEWADSIAEFYATHDEHGVSTKPEDCYGWTVDDEDDLDSVEYF